MQLTNEDITLRDYPISSAGLFCFEKTICQGDNEIGFIRWDNWVKVWHAYLFDGRDGVSVEPRGAAYAAILEV